MLGLLLSLLLGLFGGHTHAGATSGNDATVYDTVGGTGAAADDTVGGGK